MIIKVSHDVRKGFNMKPGKFRALLDSVEMGSFSRAAQIANYSQSGLTHMMNSLESEIGFPLLNRGKYGIKLTAEGERLLPLIKDYVNAEKALMDEIEHMNKEKSENLCIGTYSSMAKNWIPSIIEELQKVYPDLKIDVRVGSQDELLSWLENREVDLCFASRYGEFDYEFIPIKKDRYMVALPLSSNYYGNTYPLELINNTTFIMPSFGVDYDTKAIFDKYNIRPATKAFTVDDFAALSMVEHNLGSSMLPELMLSGLSPKAIILPLDPPVYRKLGIIYHSAKELSSVAKQTITLAKKLFGEDFDGE